MMLEIGKVLKGKELEEFLTLGATECQNFVINKLSDFEPNALFHIWRTFLLHIEEYINLDYELHGTDRSIVLNTPIDFSSLFTDSFKDTLYIISQNFGKKIAERFSTTTMMISCLFEAYSRHGIQMEPHPNNVKNAINYLQSRRLHYQTMLRLISLYAKGEKKIDIKDVMNEFQYYVDTCMVNMTTAYQRIVQARCVKDFEAIVCKEGLRFNRDYSQLEEFYLNPIRLSIIDLISYKCITAPSVCVKKTPRLYSIEELKSMISNDAIYYEKYKLGENSIYKSMITLLDDITPYFKDDYSIEIGAVDFQQICNKHQDLKLYVDVKNYTDALNSIIPFQKCGNIYYSNNFAILRYAENEILSILNRSKKYQIDAGFIFEEKVTEVVEKHGFKRNRSVKRIARREFDVVCVKGNCIYNFQCKNNYFDVTDIDFSNISKACKKNKSLESYYIKELKKEINREHLLKEKIGLSKIKHFIISRFPIYTDNPNIINFNQLEQELPLIK